MLEKSSISQYKVIGILINHKERIELIKAEKRNRTFFLPS